MKSILRNVFLSIAVAVTLAACGGCAQIQSAMDSVTGNSSPEEQIKFGADSAKAVTALATTLLKNDKISSSQAQSFDTMLRGAEKSLNMMNSDLIGCRAKTTSTPKTSPDPCRAQVVDVVNIALKNIADVKTALDKK